MATLTVSEVCKKLENESLLICVEPSKHLLGKHEAFQPAMPMHVSDEIDHEVFEELKTLPGLRQSFIMPPGMSPHWVLHHEDNSFAKRYEVEVKYVNRADDFLEL